MKRSLWLLVLCLVTGLPGWAATELEALRTQAQAARTQASTLRERQQGLRTELQALAGRIESLKAARQGALVAGGELERALRRSQELSGELTGLAQALAAAEAEQARRHLALHEALSQELSRVRSEWERAPERQARARWVERMRALRAERDSVRGALPASQLPAPGPAEASDDPEDLLEQVDALRDSQDKVRQRLAAVRSRIAEVREERELERRLGDFLGEESLFDEQDRRLRLRLDPASRAISVDRAQPEGTPESARDLPAMPAGAPPPQDASPGGSTSGTPEALPLPGLEPVRGSDVRPQVGVPGASVLAPAQPPEDLRSLEAEAAQLEARARELEARAAALELRARALE